jgi:hypothetical protein
MSLKVSVVTVLMVMTVDILQKLAPSPLNSPPALPAHDVTFSASRCREMKQGRI